MKRSPMPPRIAPLASKSPLKRTTAISSQPLSASSKHRNSAARLREPKRKAASPPRVPAKVRAALAARSGGVCEIAQRGCTRWAIDPAHRVGTGMGGRKRAAAAAHHVLSNLLHACRFCHDRCHANPADSYAAGWMLRDSQNPLALPALYRGGWRFLTDDGRVLADPDATEEAA